MYDSVEITNLPRQTAQDGDLIIIQRQGTTPFTATTSATQFKDYILKDISDDFKAKTYSADGITLNLNTTTNVFSVKKIEWNQLSQNLQNLIDGSTNTIEGEYDKTFSKPISSLGETLKITITAGDGNPYTYAIPLYRIENEPYPTL
jgi:hypothetical protein